MLIDSFGRVIDYLRISVTDKCNFRCKYCMPEEGIALKSHNNMLSYESIALITHHAAKLNIKKIRLTGGEPLIKRDIETLVKMIRDSGDFEQINMTTNGSLLDLKTAKALKNSGLTRINISLDSIDESHFRAITRTGNLKNVLHGIDNAIEADLSPIKINMVVFSDTTKNEIIEMENFCKIKGIKLQTIKHFSLKSRHQTGTAFNRPKPCNTCDKIRLTADGYLKPCLFSDNEFKIDMKNIEKSLKTTISMKPECGSHCNNRAMSQIGG